jgi:hypothetical protein
MWQLGRASETRLSWLLLLLLLLHLLLFFFYFDFCFNIMGLCFICCSRSGRHTH